MLGLIIIVVAFAFIYLVLLRPQRRQRTDQARMWETLEIGDEVVTAGGIVGKITKLSEQYVTVEVAPNIEVVVQRSAVQVPLPKGTLKTLQ
jgi:preprotein translocase subunit YajC